MRTRTLALIAPVLISAACARNVQVTSEPSSASGLPPAVITGTWKTRAPMPTPRQEMAAAVVDDKIYVVGGIDEAEQTVATLEVFDPANNTWTPGPPMPGPRHHAWAAAANGKVYVIGGYSSLARPWPAANTVFEFDPKTNAWSTKTPMPTPRGAHIVANYRNKLYVIGGATTERQLTINEVYDPASDQWSTAASMPTAREHISAEVVGSRILVFGGRAPRPGDINNYKMVEAYDPAKHTWAQAPTMPTARGGLATAMMYGHVYAFGGEYRGGVFDKVEELDPEVNNWYNLEPMVPGRTGLIAAAVGRSIYLIGGAGSPGAGALTQEFVPPRR